MSTQPNSLGSSLDYLQTQHQALQNQLFQLDPTLANHPSIPSQQDFDTALEPVASKMANIGLGAAGLVTANPLLAFPGIAATIADQFIGRPPGMPGNTLGAPVGESGDAEAGMNS